MFKDIFDAYWNGENWTCDKVLEIQNPIAIKTDWPEIRVYFGKGIDIHEWAEWNKSALSILNSMNSFMPMSSLITNSKVSMCLLDKGPRITPLGSVDVHYNLIWNMCFGSNENIDLDIKFAFDTGKSLCLWYTKEDNKYIIEPEKFNNYDNFTKQIRVRSIDLEDWKKMMRNYTKTEDKKYLEISNDIPEQSIILDKIEPVRNA